MSVWACVCKCERKQNGRVGKIRMTSFTWWAEMYSRLCVFCHREEGKKVILISHKALSRNNFKPLTWTPVKIWRFSWLQDYKMQQHSNSYKIPIILHSSFIKGFSDSFPVHPEFHRCPRRRPFWTLLFMDRPLLSPHGIENCDSR